MERCDESVAADAQATRILHDINGTHEWVSYPKAECTVCGQLGALVCNCGAQRCRECVEPRMPVDMPQFQWKQSDDAPQPFYVKDLKNIPDDEKLLFIKQELGSSASLEAFAVKFLDLFSNKVHGVISQKAAVLKLFREYSSDSSWTRVSEIPPEIRVDFQRVWNPDAPSLCLECGKKAKEAFCSAECRFAGLRELCRFCEREVVNSFCDTCRVGSPASSARPALNAPSHTVTQRDMLDLAQTTWFCTVSKDAQHEAAWKRQRRS